MKRLLCAFFAFPVAIVAVASAPAAQHRLSDGDFTMALTGDSIITRPLSVYDEPEFLEMIELIRSADVAFTNLEVLFHDYEPYPMAESGGTWMRAEPALAKELAWAGFDMVSRANNHTGDYGVGGMELTTRYVAEAGLVQAGVGYSLAEAREAKFLETAQARVALISVASTFAPHMAAGRSRDNVAARPGLNPLRFSTIYTLPPAELLALRSVGEALGDLSPRGDDQPPSERFRLFGRRFEVGESAGVRTEPDAQDVEEIAAVVRNASRLADYTIVTIHAHESAERREVPADFLPLFARAVIDAGADVFVGHGPHVLRGIEIYRGRPILYSLGDFLFQNETLLRLPADNYERYGLGADAHVADFNDARYRNDTTGFPAQREIWEAVIAVPRFQGRRLVELKLHPITLGFGLPPGAGTAAAGHRRAGGQDHRRPESALAALRDRHRIRRRHRVCPPGGGLSKMIHGVTARGLGGVAAGLAFFSILFAQDGPDVPTLERYVDEIATLRADSRVQAALDHLVAERERFRAELVELTEIPAPPFGEEVRARRFAEMLREAGLSDIRLDEAGNAVGRRPGRSGARTVAFNAHLDTVFPEGTDVTVRVEGDRFHAPGVGDDTRGLVVVLGVLRALEHAGIQTGADVWFIGNVGEEGLGDLRGVKHLFREGAEKIDSLIAVDGGDAERIVYGGIGSHRYRVTFRGPGGHSWGAFGAANPHHALGRAIALLDERAPAVTSDGPKTSYNIGRIGGGTSINSIPFESWMEVDMRSETQDKLDDIDAVFQEAMRQALAEENAGRSEGPELTVDIERVGTRPAARGDVESPLVQRAMAATRALGLDPRLALSSTDANLPLSKGIPAVTMSRGGVGEHAHSPGEWWEDVDSHVGMQIVLLTLLAEAGLAP